ncbi:hypothetical protein CDO73_18735 [Saccharibacillus sp. O23]|uniref:AraC family transcriptional regulator n=1 Tax=Saccharibacillus sp. O23 TaxID=2009338 RepID=UPI000B4E4666|nr:AraC family transcriptional regulator [Saccharibacillus sp. O23]OWR28313.1 hypothetical protein CDO73_18735 [Saccharibacillus sp. O23]
MFRESSDGPRMQTDSSWPYSLERVYFASEAAPNAAELEVTAFGQRSEYAAVLRLPGSSGDAFRENAPAAAEERWLFRIRHSDGDDEAFASLFPDSIWDKTVRLPAREAEPALTRLRSMPDGTPVDALRRQIAAQELLLALLEAHARPSASSAAEEFRAEKAVRDSIDELHRRYREPLTVAELLRISGLGRWQYGMWFRRLTGQAPLDYLNELRLEQARERLVLTDDPLREIARSVGFRDEYYFSRRFRRFMGVPPTEYRRLARRRTESVRRAGPPPPANPRRIAVSDGFVGDLLLLGARPLAAPLGIVRRQVVFEAELGGIADLGAVLGDERLAPLRPDLVLCEAADDGLLGRLGGLCAAVSLELMPPDERLRIVGERIGRADEAAAWIAAHAEALRAAWTAAGVRAGETAAAFILLDARLYVMAGQGLAATLYRTGGFLPCPKIARMIEAGVGFRRVLPEELGEYAADRFFLMRGPNEAAREDARLLIRTGAMHRHAAQLHLLDGWWNFDDAWTRHRLADALPELLRGSVPDPAASSESGQTSP